MYLVFSTFAHSSVFVNGPKLLNISKHVAVNQKLSSMTLIVPGPAFERACYIRTTETKCVPMFLFSRLLQPRIIYQRPRSNHPHLCLVQKIHHLYSAIKEEDWQDMRVAANSHLRGFLYYHKV